MKTAIAILMTVLVVPMSFAQEQVEKKMESLTIFKTDVPLAVIQQAQKDFPHVSPFQFYSAGKSADVALPQPVLQSLPKEYPGVALKKDEHTKITDHGMKKDNYVISLANGKRVRYAANEGTSLKK